MVSDILSRFYERVEGELPAIVRPPSAPPSRAQTPVQTPAYITPRGSAAAAAVDYGAVVHAPEAAPLTAAVEYAVPPPRRSTASGYGAPPPLPPAASTSSSSQEEGTRTPRRSYAASSQEEGMASRRSRGASPQEEFIDDEPLTLRGERNSTANGIPLPPASASPARAAAALADPDPWGADSTAPRSALELLGWSVEGPFGLAPGAGEVLLSTQLTVFQDWMRVGPGRHCSPRHRRAC